MRQTAEHISNHSECGKQTQIHVQLSLYHSSSLGSSAHTSILSLNDEYWIKSPFLSSFILTIPCRWPIPAGQTMFLQRSVKPRLSEDIHEAAQKWRAAVMNTQADWLDQKHSEHESYKELDLVMRELKERRKSLEANQKHQTWMQTKTWKSRDISDFEK